MSQSRDAELEAEVVGAGAAARVEAGAGVVTKTEGEIVMMTRWRGIDEMDNEFWLLPIQPARLLMTCPLVVESDC